MKPFESPLGPLMEDYLSYRVCLGYEEKGLRRILSRLDRYIREQAAGLGELTPGFFLGLKARHPKKTNHLQRPASRGKRVLCLSPTASDCPGKPPSRCPVLSSKRLYPVRVLPGADRCVALRDAKEHPQARSGLLLKGLCRLSFHRAPGPVRDENRGTVAAEPSGLSRR